MLGHAKSSITKDLYIGKVPKALCRAADRFSEMLGPGADRPEWPSQSDQPGVAVANSGTKRASALPGQRPAWCRSGDSNPDGRTPTTP